MDFIDRATARCMFSSILANMRSWVTCFDDRSLLKSFSCRSKRSCKTTKKEERSNGEKVEKEKQQQSGHNPSSFFFLPTTISKSTLRPLNLTRVGPLHRHHGFRVQPSVAAPPIRGTLFRVQIHLFQRNDVVRDLFVLLADFIHLGVVGSHARIKFQRPFFLKRVPVRVCDVLQLFNRRVKMRGQCLNLPNNNETKTTSDQQNTPPQQQHHHHQTNTTTKPTPAPHLRPFSPVH